MAEICSRAKKVIFWTERAAQLALVEAVLKKNRGANQRRESRYYNCGNHWHLTSQRKPPPRR